MNPPEWDRNTVIGAGVLLLVVIVLVIVVVVAITKRVRKPGFRGDSVLTILAAVVGTTFTAEGMWMFFHDTVGLTVFLTAAGFLFFELVQVACAVRARRKMRDAAIGHAGAEGIVLWLSAATSGFFSSTHATTWEEALIRLVVPIGVAWLWHQQMGLERQELNLAEKFEGIHWRITPERVLAFLRIAEPTARTTQQVTATRALEALAMAVQAAHAPLFGWGWPSRRRLRRALRRAVKDANLDTDPDAQRKLTATLGVLGGENTLLALKPAAPWTLSVPDESAVLTESAVLDLVDRDMIDLDEKTLSVLRRFSPDRPSPLRLKAVPTAPPVSDERPPTEPDIERPQTARSRRKIRRSLAEWVDLTGEIFDAERARIGRPPTADEFATAIRTKRLGRISDSTAKRIRSALMETQASSQNTDANERPNERSLAAQTTDQPKVLAAANGHPIGADQ